MGSPDAQRTRADHVEAVLGIVALALGTAGTGNPCSSIPTTAFSTTAAALSQHFRGWQTKSTADCGSLQQNRS